MLSVYRNAVLSTVQLDFQIHLVYRTKQLQYLYSSRYCLSLLILQQILYDTRTLHQRPLESPFLIQVLVEWQSTVLTQYKVKVRHTVIRSYGIQYGTVPYRVALPYLDYEYQYNTQDCVPTVRLNFVSKIYKIYKNESSTSIIV